jgi:hypothetical protein
MASLSRGFSFGATEQVTNAKLHTLVDSGAVTDIVTADIQDSQITDAKISSVSGSKFVTLANTPSGAGKLPNANLNTSITDHIVPSGGIIMWSGSIASIPSGWYLCNGSNSTPDLRDRFIVGAKEDDSGTAKTNVTGSLTQSGDGQLIAHTHTGPSHTHTGPSHTHDITTNKIGSVGAFTKIGSTDQTLSAATGTTEAAGTGNTGASGTGNTGSSGTGTKNVAVYYALAFIMKS